MPRDGFTGIALPDELVDRIEEFVQHEGKRWGYTKRTEVVRDAVRRFLEEKSESFQETRKDGGNDELEADQEA